MMNGRQPAASRKDRRMGGEGQKSQPRNGTGKKENPRRVQEYDFFVIRDGTENQEMSEPDRTGRANRKDNGNKGRDFFPSD